MNYFDKRTKINEKEAGVGSLFLKKPLCRTIVGKPHLPANFYLAESVTNDDLLQIYFGSHWSWGCIPTF